jgi:hypothetical protein
VWTTENILSLAPDERTKQQAQALASPGYWLGMAQNELGLWAECKSSGLSSYRVLVLWKGPILRCSCPRPQPCKHSLALLLFHQEQPELWLNTSAPPPAWAQEWIEARLKAAGESKPNSSVSTPKSEEEKQKRQEKRWESYQQGLVLFGQQLRGLAERGLQELYGSDWWQQAAARLGDAKLSRLAGELRLLGEEFAGDQELERSAYALGQWYLLLQAFEQRQTLSADLSEELLNLLGRTLRKNDLWETQPHRFDQWMVLGIKEEVLEGNPPRHSRSIWIQGRSSQSWGLILDFSVGFQAQYDYQYPVGTILQGATVAYPGLSWRVLLSPEAQLLDESLVPSFSPQAIGQASWADFVLSYAQALAQNPWHEEHPLVLSQVLVLEAEGQAQLLDPQGHLIPLKLALGGALWWKLLALSGGQEMALFGLWNGQHFEALSWWTGQRWKTLH